MNSDQATLPGQEEPCEYRLSELTEQQLLHRVTQPEAQVRVGRISCHGEEGREITIVSSILSSVSQLCREEMGSLRPSKQVLYSALEFESPSTQGRHLTFLSFCILICERGRW